MTSTTTSANRRSDFWIDLYNADNKYRYVVERVYEDGVLVQDRDINRFIKDGVYGNKLYPSTWFYAREYDPEEDEGELEEAMLNDDFFADESRWKKVSMCKAKKYLDYKGPWPE